MTLVLHVHPIRVVRSTRVVFSARKLTIREVKPGWELLHEFPRFALLDWSLQCPLVDSRLSYARASDLATEG